MRSLESLDAMFRETVQQYGGVPTSALFDKRVTAPLRQLPLAVEQETGAHLPAARLGEIIEAGWLPALPHESEAGHEIGFAGYAPRRVSLYLRLEREGYDHAEIAALAAYEEALIDDYLTAGGYAYLDDPVDECVRHLTEEIREFVTAEEALAQGPHAPNFRWAQHLAETWGCPAGANVPTMRRGLSAMIARARAEIDRLQSTDWEAASAEARLLVERNAFVRRVDNDVARLWTVEVDQGQIAAGYSPMLMFRERGRTDERGYYFDGLLWELSLRSPWLTEDLDAITIRLPGLKIVGADVLTTRRHTPAEYKTAWQTFDLEMYLALRATLRGERTCPHCKTVLPGGADARRQYCSESCRQAARQRRYRERKPEQVKQSRQRWYRA